MNQRAKLDDRVEAIRVKYDLRADDFWELPQKRGSYCVKHSALEVVATKARIKFSPPQILEADSANGLVSILVTGSMDDMSIWSIGECSPKNNKNSYPWAMAEKRGIDRVILKLVGLHGLVYSDAEADEFNDAPAPEPKQESSPPKPKQKTVGEKKDLWAGLMEEVKAEGAKGYKKIDAYMLNPDTKALIEDLGDYKQQFLEEVRQVRNLAKAGEEISGQPVGKIMERVLPSFENLDTSPDPLEELLDSQQGDD